jgi:hypothetical protein
MTTPNHRHIDISGFGNKLIAFQSLLRCFDDVLRASTINFLRVK